MGCMKSRVGKSRWKKNVSIGWSALSWMWVLILCGCQPARVLPQPLVIHLTGTEHLWQAEYVLEDGQSLRVGPELHVPVDWPVEFVLESNDYIYTLAIPAFGLKEIAVPELEFRMSLRAEKSGVFALIGEEMCGLPGEAGPGQLVVESLESFRAWFERQ